MSVKQKIIIALNDEELTKQIVSLVDQQIDRAQTVLAEDGKQLQSKIENDPPNIIVLCDRLTKLSGGDVIRSLQPRLLKELAVVIVDQIPEPLEFADRVATGQFQYIAPEDVTEKFAEGLKRSLAWLKRGDTVEFTMKRVKAGEFLMRQGDKAESVYILKKGHMKAYVKNGAEPVSHGFLLGEIEAKEFVGEMAYINGDVRSADVVADTDCELIEIPIAHLRPIAVSKARVGDGVDEDVIETDEDGEPIARRRLI